MRDECRLNNTTTNHVIDYKGYIVGKYWLVQVYGQIKIQRKVNGLMLWQKQNIALLPPIPCAEGKNQAVVKSKKTHKKINSYPLIIIIIIIKSNIW
jgi:hypothetical protein